MENLEVWKDVVGYEKLYQVSSLGNVKSLSKGILFKKAFRRSYFAVCLTKERKEKTYSTHRLVAIAFIPNPDNKPQVNHINGLKTDNRVENLEWNTASENTQHSFDNRLQVIIRGEGCYNSKLTAKDVLEIRKSKLPQRTLGKIYGISGSVICEVRTGKTWSHI